MSQKLQVASVPYLVARPLVEGLGQDPRVQLTFDVPSRLVCGLREKQYDVALASVIEVFRTPGCTIVPDLCIAAYGEVMSVRVFLRKPLTQIRSVALDPSSETGAALLRVLIDHRKLSAVEWISTEQGQAPESVKADAYLRIGDEALRQMNSGELESLDLAQEWKAATGLPFVFAVWIVRPGVKLGETLAAFQSAARSGLSRRGEYVIEASKSLNLPEPFLRRYLLDACRYQLGSRELQGLRAYRDHAAKLQLCRPDLEIQFAT